MPQSPRLTLWSGVRVVVCGLFLAQGAVSLAPFVRSPFLAVRPVSRSNPVDVTLIADTSGPNKTIGLEMQQGATDAIEKRGLASDIRLVVRDDGGRPEAVSALADGAAEGFRTLAIVGPTEAEAYGSVAASAKEGQVVAIMPIGAPTDAANNEWVFTLQGSVIRDGEVLGRVIQRLATGGDVVLLAKADAGGVMSSATSTLIEAPQTTSDALFQGLKNAYSDSPPRKVRRLDWTGDANLFSEATRSDAVVIDLPKDDAAAALKSLRLTSYRGVTIGYGDASLTRFPELFSGTIQEKIEPGFFTDGLICPVPFTARIAASKSQGLIKQYVSIHHRDPSWAYAFGYDAGLTIAEFEEAEKAQGKFDLTNPDRLRSDLRDYLLTTKNRVLTGFTGDIQFNGGNQRDFPPKLVAYARGVQTPYVLQLNETPILAQSIEDSAP